MEQERKIIEGPPIYIESLMTLAEYKENHKRFPNTNRFTKFQHTLGDFDPKEFRWRYRMGDSFTTEECRLYNKAFEETIRILNEKSNTRKDK